MVCSFPRCDCCMALPEGRRPDPGQCPRSQECQTRTGIRELGEALDRLMERPSWVWADSDCVRDWIAHVDQVHAMHERVQEGLLAKYAPERVQ